MVNLTLVCDSCNTKYRGTADNSVNLRMNATVDGWYIMTDGDFCEKCGDGTVQSPKHQAGTGGNPPKAGSHETTI